MPFSFRTGRTRFAVAAAAFSVCLTALTGCSDSGGGGGGSSSAPATPSSPPPSSPASSRPPAGQMKVSIKDFTFRPADLTVAPGTKITVTNNDTTTHTMTATKGKAFDTGDIAAGSSATFTAPSKAGGYPYDCTIHPFMTGTLTVK